MNADNNPDIIDTITHIDVLQSGIFSFVILFCVHIFCCFGQFQGLLHTDELVHVASCVCVHLVPWKAYREGVLSDLRVRRQNKSLYIINSCATVKHLSLWSTSRNRQVIGLYQVDSGIYPHRKISRDVLSSYAKSSPTDGRSLRPLWFRIILGNKSYGFN